MRDRLSRCHCKAVALDAQETGVLRRTQVNWLGIVKGERISLCIGLFCNKKMLSKTCFHISVFALLSSPFTPCHIKNSVPTLKFSPYLNGHNAHMPFCSDMGTHLIQRASAQVQLWLYVKWSGIDLSLENLVSSSHTFAFVMQNTDVCFLLNNSVHNNERASPELLN